MTALQSNAAAPTAALSMGHQFICSPFSRFLSSLTPLPFLTAVREPGYPFLMPWLSAVPCRYPGCGVLIRGRHGHCDEHRPLVRQQQDQHRPSAAARGYDSDWRRRRAEFLAEHTECARCSEPSRIVDHITPLSAGGADDESNWQALCKQCHDSWKQSIDRRGDRGIKSLGSSLGTGRAGSRVRPQVPKEPRP
jgi:5-methylcytosine-specific restriction protein A